MTQQTGLSSGAESHFSGRAGDHAIVIGGSIAGVLAARVLTDHFDSVTIVERDRFPERPEFRKGVPQSWHLHALFVRGRRILDQLFPDLEAEWAAAGALTFDFGDIAFLSPAGWAVRFRSGMPFLSCTRHLLEWCVRRQLAASTKVCFLEECEVTALLPNADKTRVVGVRLRFRNRPAGKSTPTEDLAASLVVDCSGRNSNVPTWLQELGYVPPEELTVNAFVGYSSCFYARPTGFQADWQGLIILPTLADPRGAALLPIEGNAWIVTLYGYRRDYPPVGEVGFLNFAQSLRTSLLYEAIKDARPLSPIRGFRSTENRLRRYECLSRWPEQFVALGDSVCAVNPVYNQGMTVCARAAMVLDECLREQRRRRPSGDLTGLSRGFQKKVAKSNSSAWRVATSQDARHVAAKGGRRDLLTRVMGPYMARLINATTYSTKARMALLRVVNMDAAPIALFHPSVMWVVLRGGGGQRSELHAASI